MFSLRSANSGDDVIWRHNNDLFSNGGHLGSATLDFLRWLPRVSTKVTTPTGKSYKRNLSSAVLQSLFLRFASKITNIITLIFQFCLLGIGRCYGNKTSTEWRIFSINSSLLFNILTFPRWNFFKLSYLVKMIFTYLFAGEKYGVVQKVSPISRDLLFLTIKLNCSDRMLVSQNVKKFRKIHRRKREKIYC